MTDTENRINFLPSTSHKTILCLLLVLLTFSAFIRVLSHDFVHYDDDLYIVENRHVNTGLTWENIKWAFTQSHSSHWHPLTWLSHMLDYELFGLNPGMHHLTSLLFHIAATALLFLSFQLMTGQLTESAFFAALFAVHPLHVESVAWVAERKDVLSTFFWMLTMYLYARYAKKPAASTYVMVCIVFALGLMAKPMLVTLPFVLLLLDYWPLNRIRFGKKAVSAQNLHEPSSMKNLIIEKLPLFFLSAISSVITVVAQKTGGSLTSLQSYPMDFRIANAIISYAEYIVKMFLPFNLAVFYPHPGVILTASLIKSALLLLLISAVALRWIRYRYILVGWLWYLGTSLPVIGLVQVGMQSMADRYTYIPLNGLFIMIVWGISEYSSKRTQIKNWMTATGTLIIVCLAGITYIQTGYWKNGITLFQRAASVTDSNILAHNNLALLFQKSGQYEKAVWHYKTAITMDPENPVYYNDLGLVYDKMGRQNMAIDAFQKALRLNPEDADVHYNLGNAMAVRGDFKGAVENYQQALAINPSLADAANNLANIFIMQGKNDQAIEYYRKALESRPNFAEAHNNLGIALAKNKETDKAVFHFKRALILQPDFSGARQNLQRVLSIIKKNKE